SANYLVLELVAGRITVTALVGTGGADTLMPIERAQFSDQAFVFGGLNEEPVGLLALNSNTPAEGQQLTVSIAGVTDGNNVTAANPTGAITGPVSYFWQVETVPDSGVFDDITVFDAGESSRAHALT